MTVCCYPIVDIHWPTVSPSGPFRSLANVTYSLCKQSTTQSALYILDTFDKNQKKTSEFAHRSLVFVRSNNLTQSYQKAIRVESSGKRNVLSPQMYCDLIQRNKTNWKHRVVYGFTDFGDQFQGHAITHDHVHR